MADLNLTQKVLNLTTTTTMTNFLIISARTTTTKPVWLELGLIPLCIDAEMAKQLSPLAVSQDDRPTLVDISYVWMSLKKRCVLQVSELH